MRESRGRHPSRARALLTALLVSAVAGAVVLGTPSVGRSQSPRGIDAAALNAVPESRESPAWTLAAPLTSRAGTPLFSEGFDAQSTATGEILLGDYVGTGGMRYTADGLWAVGSCNGLVTSDSTPQPSCAGVPLWFSEPPYYLGLAQGLSEAAARTNNALTFLTNETDTVPGYLVRTNAEVPAVAGHYYAPSFWSDEYECGSTRLGADLFIDGSAYAAGADLSSCQADHQVTYGSHLIAPLTGGVVKVPSGTGTHTVGMGVYLTGEEPLLNHLTSLDSLQVLDVTPALDTSFSPSTIVQGETSTLTFMVTNTSELGAKDDWAFADTLPTGMTLANGSVGGTCVQEAGAAYATTATAGGHTIGVTGGDLAPQQASCTITVRVTTDRAGTFTHGPALVGGDLALSASTALTVTAAAGVGRWTFDKRIPAGGVVDANGNGITDAGDTVAFEFVFTNTGTVTMTNPAVTDPLLTAAGIGTTCPDTTLAPGASMTCTADSPYPIAQADVDAGGVTNAATSDAELPQGVSGPPDPIEDTITTKTVDRRPAVTLDKRVQKTRDVDHDGGLGFKDEIFYEFEVSNTGNVTLSHPVVTDQLLATQHIAVTCPQDTVAPGRSIVCRGVAPYVVTAADVRAGRVVNAAVVELDGPDDLPGLSPAAGETSFRLGGPTGARGPLPSTGASPLLTVGVPVGLLLLSAGLGLLFDRRRGDETRAGSGRS